MVRGYIKKVKGFKKKKIYYRKDNYGLAKNIISGVTEILKKEKKAIILEDDLVFSKNFLSFMNKALNFYEKKKVFHISGWNYNLDLKIKEDSFFTRGMNCWGWATWKNRWKYFEKKPNKILSKWKNDKIKMFNFDNSYNFFSNREKSK